MAHSARDLRFTLRLLSPCYAGGADPESGPLEPLRVPSLRGALRFWWRAAEVCDSSEELFRREAGVFGSADRGQGVRIVPVGIPQRLSADTDHRSFSQKYLGYGAASERQRKAIPAGVSFSYRAFGSPSQIEGLRRSLLLLHLFGGLGARSRRGWGSVDVVTHSPGQPVVPEPGEMAPDRWLAQALDAVWPDRSHRPSGRSADPRWSAFTSSSRLAVVGPYGSWKQVLEGFYERFKSIKDDVREAVEGEAPARVWLGLPWAYGDPPTEYGVRGARTVNRRASPLCLSVLAHGGDLYGSIAFLGGTFLGADGDLFEQSRQGRHQVSLPGRERARDLFFQASTLGAQQHDISLP